MLSHLENLQSQDLIKRSRKDKYHHPLLYKDLICFGQENLGNRLCKSGTLSIYLLKTFINSQNGPQIYVIRT